MNLRPLLISLALALACRAAEPPRISIPALLEPATRMREFQRYRIATQPVEAEQERWQDPNAFATFHTPPRAIALWKPGEATRYAVVWGTDFDSDWNDRDSTEAADPPVLTPLPVSSLQIFSAEGVPVSEIDQTLGGSIIADLRGNAELEVLEKGSAEPSQVLPPTATAAEEIAAIKAVLQSDPDKPDHPHIDYLSVHPLDRPTEISLAVVFNDHPANQAAGNTWGFQAQGPGQDGTYVIQLGPVLAPFGIDPRVCFHWDKARRQWSGPAPKPGDHFRVLDGKELEALTLCGSSGLHYPLAPAPQPNAPRVDSLELNEALRKPPAPAAAYVYRSLAGLPEQALLSYFSSEKAGPDVRAARIAAATSVPDFWQLDPKQAALHYVRRNRPPEFENRYLLSIVDPGSAAPLEGDVSLSIDPLGLEKPPPRAVYQLHCSRAGSFLARTSLLTELGLPGPLYEPLLSEARKLDLTYRDARQLFETIWWMWRIRSRCLTPDSEIVMGGGFDLPFGMVRLKAAGADLVESSSIAPKFACFAGVGELNGNYDRHAFVSLVVKLLETDAPKRFGAAWASLAVPARLSSTAKLREAGKVKAISAGLLGDFNQGALGPEALRAVVIPAGWLGWQDQRVELEKAAARLPPPTADEHLLLQLEADLDA